MIVQITAQRTDFKNIAPLRELFRAEAGCQIVRDSILPRGLADPYRILVDGNVAGYGGVWNEHFPGRLMEFFVLPEHRGSAPHLFRSLVDVSGATHAEAQTNIALQHEMLLRHLTEPVTENLLFGDGPATNSPNPDFSFRPRAPEDTGPDGEWVAERAGEVVGAGGLLHHYNPPFADLFMEVVPPARRQGVGSFLVQELRRVCRESGKIHLGPVQVALYEIDIFNAAVHARSEGDASVNDAMGNGRSQQT